MTEIAMLSGLKSPYVTKYHGAFLQGSDLWIVMEYCSGGSCADLMKPGTLSETEIAIIIKELLHGLVYLHADGKLHRDIKGIFFIISFPQDTELTQLQLQTSLSVAMGKSSSPILASQDSCQLP